MMQTAGSSPQTDCGLCLTLAADSYITDCCTKIICEKCYLDWL
jgi:hypothetical protein